MQEAMQEVAIRLRFQTPCLGNSSRHTAKNRSLLAMPRDAQGRVMFLPSWWCELLTYAAHIRSHYQSLAGQVRWASYVAGTARPWRRVICTAAADARGRARYALHEAFLPGTELTVTAVLPAGLGIAAVIDLLTVAGTYKGISPFRDDVQRYGQFEVVSVLPTVTQRLRVQEGEAHGVVHTAVREPD